MIACVPSNTRQHFEGSHHGQKVDSNAKQATAEVSKAKPSDKLKAALKKPLGRDEMSTGKGRALRAAAEKNLGSGPFSARADLAAAVGLKVNAFGALSHNAVAVGRPTEAEKQKAKDRLSLCTSPAGLATSLRDEKDPAVHAELIRLVVTGGDATHLLTQFMNSASGSDLNHGLDDMKVIATAVGDAYRSGAITDADLKKMAKKMGPDASEALIQTLASDPNNCGPGGPVDALGKQAQALGFDRAAALAFTSSDALIASHYPTPAAQKEAFKFVKDYVDELTSEDAANTGAGPRNGLEEAVLAAARLTANGNGYKPADLQKELEALGPEVSGELIANAGARGDTLKVPGPLDTLGDAATAIAAKNGKKADDWSTDAAIAYTQGPALIAANLSDPKDPTKDAALKDAAFKAINTYLAKNRDEWARAADGDTLGPYSLVKLPQALEGLERLVGANPSILTRELGTTKGQADLVQLYESVSLNPAVPQGYRDTLGTITNTLIANAVGGAGKDPNAPLLGDQLGTLLGVLQIAGDRAVAAADGGDKSAVQAFTVDLVKGLTGSAIGALLAETGPLGEAVGGAVSDAVLTQIFGAFDQKDPSVAALRDAYVKQLHDAGIDVSNGEQGKNAVTGNLEALQADLNNQLNAAKTQDEINKIQKQLNLVTQLLTGILKGYGGSIDSSSEAAGGIQGELNHRKDKV